MKSPFQGESLPQPQSEIELIFTHNQELLSNDIQEAGRNMAVFGMRVEDKKCLAKPMNLYVERASGKILAVTSIEKEKREHAYDDGNFAVSPYLPNVLYPVPVASPVEPVFGDIAKVPVWHISAYPFLDKTKQVITDKILIDRPESWSRNDQIILGDELMDVSIDVLLPDPLDRGVLLKSLENFNTTEEPNYVDA